MKLILLFVVALFVPMIPALAGQGGVDEDELERGEYLVHHVAKCIECHSPRNSQGELDRSRLLKGAPMPVRSPFPNERWAFQAPVIAGLPGYTPSAAIYLLTNGTRESGQKPRSPMPEYRMSPQDAAAVVAYLKSLD